MPDSTLATLAQIQQKVRRITRSPSEEILSTDELNKYINTFLLYDFPAHLRLWSQKSTFTFYTQANIDTYETSSDPNSPLFNFKNKYITTDKPVYCAGYEIGVYQNRERFFAVYPKVCTINGTGFAGDGVNTTFVGTISSVPFLQNNVLFNSIGANNETLQLIDYPITVELGALGLPGIPETIPSQYGQVNYLTGAYTINFPSAPAASEPINYQVVYYAPSRPQAILFFDDYMVLRPVPDQAYAVQMEVFVRPEELINSIDEPFLAQWWQYIALGASRKIFEDRADMDSVLQIMPLFQEQERLVNRTTLVQITKNRAATIYQNQLGGPGVYNWYSQNY